jgi:hypothetical protein
MWGRRSLISSQAVSDNKDGSSDVAHSIGIGYGFSHQWFSEVYAKYKSEGQCTRKRLMLGVGE